MRHLRNGNFPRRRTSANISRCGLGSLGRLQKSKQSSVQKSLSFETGFSSSWGRRPVVSQKPLMNQFCSKIASQHNGRMIFCNEEIGGIRAVNIHCAQTPTKPNSISYGETEDDTKIKTHARWKVWPRTVWRNYPRRKQGLQLSLCRYNDKG